MKKVTILILEDSPFQKLCYQEMLEDWGYLVLSALSFDEANCIIQNHHDKIDIAILDIMIRGQHKGIEMAKILNSYGIPFFFLTSYPKRSFKKAKDVNPIDFILKSSGDQQLRFSLEFHLEKIIAQGEKYGSLWINPYGFWIQEDGKRIKSLYSNITKIVASNNDVLVYLETARNHLTRPHMIHATNVKIGKLMDEYLSKDIFGRIHKSFIINKEKIEAYNKSDYTVLVAGEALKVSKTYRQEIEKLF